MRKLLSIALMLLLALPCGAHSVVKKNGMYVISHEWSYKNDNWSCNLSIPVELYRYYKGRAHKSDDMVKFVLSDFDRNSVRALMESFREGGTKERYTDSDNMRNVVCFVQSLRYVTDMESTGEDEYVRFPIETLVDGIGDCEDMSILAASILHEMGYAVLLVHLPDHLALAVNCREEIPGTYYSYQEERYYYLEVTNPGWDIGHIPDDFKQCKATLVPLVYRPDINLQHCDYHSGSYYLTDAEVPCTVHCRIENAGPGTTSLLTLRAVFRRNSGTAAVNRTFAIDNLREGESAEYELNIPIPRPFSGKLEISVEGANFDTDFMTLNGINLQ